MVTYLRSGSTLTADIIEQSNDVFYVYEPLHSFPQQIYYTETQICNISTGDCRHPENELEDPNVVKINLFNILTCQFGNLTQRIYFDMRFHAKRSKAMNQYDKCRNNETHDICIEQLEKLCHQKPIKSVKEIRITMEIANWLMGVIPNLKIIHLLRDPRGMLASQKSGHFIIDNAPTVAKAACNRFQRDVLVTHKMSKIYPGRIKLIVYEEIAENPVQTLNKLYDFLGLTVSQNITNYVLNITRSGKENNGYYNVVRSDSVKTAYKWRSNLNWQTVQQIDTECKEFYELTGFKAFKNELNYQDTSFKTRDDTVY
ncbi:hypothetical protein KUTeg_015083 [Tegillarca granosa]|uniref:Sulfotransferase n=1 Tax=Tegillarca granosa TaxID=220873 RepID=A0ABQ9EP53_TEGGR|nr:hypothetical protein KUTeg_015083 [Tegillarca granosa]